MAWSLRLESVSRPNSKLAQNGRTDMRKNKEEKVAFSLLAFGEPDRWHFDARRGKKPM